MNHQEFEQVMECQFERCKNILGQKAKEYAEDDDRLHNFKQAAGLMQCSDQYALGGMLAKHMISIYDMIQTHIQDYPMEQWNEKITDAINYLVLLKAIASEILEPVITQIRSFELNEEGEAKISCNNCISKNQEEVVIGFNFEKCFEQTLPRSCDGCIARKECAKVIQKSIDLEKLNND